MALDPDTKALLDALLAGQVRQDAAITRLAEGQERHEVVLGRLAALTSTLVDAHAKLTTEVEHLTVQVDSLAGEVRHLGDRLDRFGEQVVQGFTASIERDRELGARLDSHGERLDNLERDR